MKAGASFVKKDCDHEVGLLLQDSDCFRKEKHSNDNMDKEGFSVVDPVTTKHNHLLVVSARVADRCTNLREKLPDANWSGIR